MKLIALSLGEGVDPSPRRRLGRARRNVRYCSKQSRSRNISLISIRKGARSMSGENMWTKKAEPHAFCRQENQVSRYARTCVTVSPDTPDPPLPAIRPASLGSGTVKSLREVDCHQTRYHVAKYGRILSVKVYTGHLSRREGRVGNNRELAPT